MNEKEPRHAELVRILLVEDNPGDIRLTTELFREAKLINPIELSKDGEDALARLRREGEHAGKPLPDLVLLDLGLPKKKGGVLLAEMREDPDLKHIPVVVLTASKDDGDIIKTHKLHANSYVVKPMDIDGIVEAVRSIDEFFLSIVRRTQP